MAVHMFLPTNNLQELLTHGTRFVKSQYDVRKHMNRGHGVVVLFTRALERKPEYTSGKPFQEAPERCLAYQFDNF